MEFFSLHLPLFSKTFLEYSTIFFPFLFFALVLIILYRHQNKNAIIPTNWPVIGMLPTIIAHRNQPHDYITHVLSHAAGGAFLLKGPWFSNMHMLGTSNPLDIHHVMSKSFTNYPKGQKLRNIFDDILGDGFTNTDGELWEFQRRTFMSLFKLPSFRSLSKRTIWNKVENGLLPVLECASKQGADVDLQDIFQRFAFDTMCTLLFDYDPQSMSNKFPHMPCEKALSDIEEVIFHRIARPEFSWKAQRLLRMGGEKRLINACKAIDQFIYKCLSQMQNESTNIKNEIEEETFKLSTSLIKELKNKSGTSGDPNKFLRDNFLNLITAGKNSTSSALSMFFYLLGKNPRVEDKIQEELQTKLKQKTGIKLNYFITHEAHNLVYLHAALCEVLRLFPPVPFQLKTPIQPDILPSGHQVDHNTSVVLCYYTMGRMKSIWGEDCMEFKPERWISKAGDIIHQPSYKFPAFNVGPRSCLGKEMSFSQMKIVAATIIHKYHVTLVEGQPMILRDSIILTNKHGLKVRLTKRRDVKHVT